MQIQIPPNFKQEIYVAAQNMGIPQHHLVTYLKAMVLEMEGDVTDVEFSEKVVDKKEQAV